MQAPRLRWQRLFTRRWRWMPVLAMLIAWGMSTACRSTYYALWEKMGRQKRDLLRSNVEAAQSEQQAASRQFETALEQLQVLYGYRGGDLERAYNRFNAEYERCVERADDLRDRIRKVEAVAGDLFAEWNLEMKTISNPALRDSSRQKLEQTREKYDSLHTSMKKAEQSMDPILTQFRDNVLYLKHNLNAQAIGALKGESLKIEADIEQLLADMNRSIAEAGAFLKGLD